MKIGVLALALPVCLFAVEFNDTQQRTFPVSGPGAKLTVENINGRIVVTGDSGNSIRVVAKEYWKADTQAELEDGRREVRLEMQQTGNEVKLFLDGPFRDRNREDRRPHNWHFRHDFEIQVPKKIALSLKTINGDLVRAEGTNGDFSVRNINGRLELIDIAGSGEAETINGRVQVRFVENPRTASRFKTLNGTLDIAFQPDLSADLKLKSMHGDAYTDFDVTPVASPVTVARSDSPLRYRVDKSHMLRVGSGGVEHSFETLNGNIKITKYRK